MRAVSSVLFGWTFLRTTIQKKNSDSSKELLCRGWWAETRGEGQYIYDFVKEVHVILQKDSTGHKKVATSHQEQVSVLVLF